MAVRIVTLMICLLLAPAVVAAQGAEGADSLAAGSAEKIEQLEQRIQDLERTRAAQEEASAASSGRRSSTPVRGSTTRCPSAACSSSRAGRAVTSPG